MPRKKKVTTPRQGRVGPRGGEKRRAIQEKLRQLKKFPRRK